MLNQTFAELTPAQVTYIEKRREAARAAKLATFACTLKSGHKAVCVESQSAAGKWHIVRRLGGRLVCDCKAMMNPDTGEYDRFCACIHTQTVYLILQGELERHAVPSGMGAA